jgi:hypothetical protein
VEEPEHTMTATGSEQKEGEEEETPPGRAGTEDDICVRHKVNIR